MRLHRTLSAILGLLALGTAATRADDIADFNAVVEAASAHLRTAQGYLRSDNVDLATLALERADTAWRDLVGRSAANPPAPLAGNPLFGTTLTTVATHLVAARMFLASGRPEATAEVLQAIRQDLAALRRAGGITVLADCVLEANVAIDRLLAAGHDASAGGPARAEMAGMAAAAGETLRRCDALASPTQRIDLEFRRLIDGALQSLAKVPAAVAADDAGLLGRLIDELRAFDRLLAFRYG
jgi:hypothetical protein